MSLHTDRAFHKAHGKRAAAAVTFARWHELMSLSKREMAELVCHYAARCTDSYDLTLESDEALLGEIRGELKNLKTNGLV